MDPQMIAALGGFVVGFLGVVISIFTARNSATRQEVESLRQTIRALTEENDRLRGRVKDLESADKAKDQRIDELEAEVDKLRSENHTLKSGKK